MLESERLIIRQFAVDLKSDVIPSDILPYLLCLTEDDCEQIQVKQDREGPRAAVSLLLDRLKKRPGAFKQFLTALEKTGCGHLKTSLENAEENAAKKQTPEQNNTTQEETSNSQSEMLGTPTTETAEPSLPTTNQATKLTTSKKPKGKLKLKSRQIPKENTTSPPKTEVKTNSIDPQSANTKNVPCVKLLKVAKDTTNTPSKKSCVPQMLPKHPPGKTKEGPEKQTSITNPICTQSFNQSDPNSQPTETEVIENSKTQYDTFLCYAKKNREIALELKTFLETKCHLQVCIDVVNFVPGKPKTDNIIESIKSSGSIIFLLSPEFLRKLWAPWELKNAIYDFVESRNGGKHKNIIPVLLEECQLPEELRIYTAIEMKGYESRKDCWKKLAAAVTGNDNSGDYSSDDDGDDDSDDDDNSDGGSDDDNNNGGTNINYPDANVNAAGEDAVYGSNEASTHDDVDHDGIHDSGVDKGGVEDSSGDSVEDSDSSVDGHDCIDDVGGDGNAVDNNHNSDDVSDDVDYNNGDMKAEVDGTGDHTGGDSGNNTSDHKKNDACNNIDSL